MTQKKYEKETKNEYTYKMQRNETVQKGSYLVQKVVFISRSYTEKSEVSLAIYKRHFLRYKQIFSKKNIFLTIICMTKKKFLFDLRNILNNKSCFYKLHDALMYATQLQAILM